MAGPILESTKQNRATLIRFLRSQVLKTSKSFSRMIVRYSYNYTRQRKADEWRATSFVDDALLTCVEVIITPVWVL
jgi:hypothetical protein